MISFLDLTQQIQSDYVKEARSKEILRAVGSVVDDVNSKMPLRDVEYSISESSVVGVLTGVAATSTITGLNSQFADLAVGDHFNVSESTTGGGDDLDGDYTIVTKTDDNTVIVAETVADGSGGSSTAVSYMSNDDVHVTYDYSNDTLEIVSSFIEVGSVLVDDDEWEAVTDYVFENADSTYEYMRFLDRRTIEFKTDITDSTLSVRMVKEYDRPSSTSESIDLPNEFQRILILGVAGYLMTLPKYHAIYKESAQAIGQQYVAEFTARAKKEYDRYPERTVELEYKY